MISRLLLGFDEFPEKGDEGVGDIVFIILEGEEAVFDETVENRFFRIGYIVTAH